MDKRITQLAEEIKTVSLKNLSEIEHFRIQMLGKKGRITALFKELKTLQLEEKKRIGKNINDLKSKVTKKIKDTRNQIEKLNVKKNLTDLTRSAPSDEIGSRHPISIIKKRIIQIFSQIGYIVLEDREIEDDWHVFSALNFPEEHPAKICKTHFFYNTIQTYFYGHIHLLCKLE